ncbi:glyoxylate reductase/hydroxypyruvate reductase [Eurytemora carolleeae]|uniref:glyoxylate reductase/hydroxypyruvate reductase n=1 Tax=Eurytemora carolleeae TaxID=1294199 RepID=UPI000C77ABAB|nr:glyoxylate reductase/hydroxypyruvate reductase [Eurytemora carolleeae]|eukprot:XP_023336021.1 glyoxylate reductase/hydroxypyruvate reductase-like [Eurytemora affinis]
MAAPGGKLLKVFVTRCKSAIPVPAAQLLEQNFQVEYWTKPDPIPRENLLLGVRGVDGIFCILTDKIDKQILDAAGPGLKVISTMSVGLDHLDVKEIQARNIKIGYTPNVLTDATADLTIALLLATSRRIMEGNTALKTGEWSSWSPLWMCGPALRGSTVGIVGLGRIGEAVMSRLKPFGVERFVYSGRARKSVEIENGAEFISFEDLLVQADFVIISTAYTEEMAGMFNKKVFNTMKKTAILINISRGGIINQEDLVEALESKQIFAAGLDVMVPEPLPADHPLTRLDNCVLLPHLGSAELQTRNTMGLLTAKNIEAALNSSPMPAEY